MQVRLDNVTKEFESKKNKVKAVNELSLTIKSGTLFGFLGPSGCGKSTTLFMLAGVYPLTKGKLFFDDRDVTDLTPENREVGMVFQNYALYPHLTVRENIAFPLVNSKKLTKKLKESAKQQGIPFSKLVENKVLEAAGIVEITSYLDRRPAELSGGQQQRVAIARAIVKEPSLLLLDEPLSNLDARLRLQTREEIRRIQRKTKITTVFVTHDQEEALNICDEIAIMKDGILQQTGNPQYIYDNPDNLFVAKFLGSFPINILEAVVKDGKLFLEGPAGETPLMDVVLPNGNYNVGIRPENIIESNTGIKVTVQRKVRRGGITTAEALTEDGQSMTFVLGNATEVNENSVLNLAMKGNSCCIFDQDGRKVYQC